MDKAEIDILGFRHELLGFKCITIKKENENSEGDQR